MSRFYVFVCFMVSSAYAKTALALLPWHYSHHNHTSKSQDQGMGKVGADFHTSPSPNPLLNQGQSQQAPQDHAELRVPAQMETLQPLCATHSNV